MNIQWIKKCVREPTLGFSQSINTYPKLWSPIFPGGSNPEINDDSNIKKTRLLSK